MEKFVKLLIITLALSLPITVFAGSDNLPGASGQSATAGSTSTTDGSVTSAKQAEYARLQQELAALRERLSEKKKELAKIRHKWLVNKGRLPTQEELKDFEEKRKKGPVTVADNPYINKNPLSTPGRYREAYYKKQAEIKLDEEQIDRLNAEISALNMQ